MRLADLPRLLLRRWYFVVPGLIAAVLLAAVVMVKVPPRQELTSSVLLLPPTSSIQNGANPYLGLGGLEGAADVVAKSMSDEDVQQDVAAIGIDSYTVERDLTTAAPIILITVDADDIASARAALALLTNQVPKTLSEIQDAINVPAGSSISSEVIVLQSEPLVIRSPQVRAVMVAAAVGVALTLVLATLLDFLLSRRTVRRSANHLPSGADVQVARRSHRASSRSGPRSSRLVDDAGEVAELETRKRGEVAPTRLPRRLDVSPSEDEERWKA